MTSRTHDAFAFASLITVAAFYQPTELHLTTLIVSVIAADIGATLPDIDQAGNRLWEMLPSGHTLGRIFRRIFYKHRTLTHSLIGVYAIYKLLDWGLPKIFNTGFVDINIVIISLMIGYLSHLLADSLTEEGLPLLFPINLTFGIPPIRKLRIKTGRWFENLVVYPAIWVYLVWFINENKEGLLNLLNLVKG